MTTSLTKLLEECRLTFEADEDIRSLEREHLANPQDTTARRRYWNAQIRTGARVQPNSQDLSGVQFPPGTDTGAMKSLLEFIDTNFETQRHYNWIAKNNLPKKIKKGVYDPALTPKLWSYVVDTAAKRFHVGRGGHSATWMHQFPKKARVVLAGFLAHRYESQWAAGQHDVPMD